MVRLAGHTHEVAHQPPRSLRRTSRQHSTTASRWGQGKVHGVDSPTTHLADDPVSPKTSGGAKRLGIVAAALASLLLAGCQVPSFGANKGVTTQSHKVYSLWQGFMVIGLIVGGFTLLLIIYAALAYRKRSDAIPRQTQYNTKVEIIYTVIPTIIVGFLFYFTIHIESPETAVVTHPYATVNVAAFQWGWRFAYPGTQVTVIGQTTANPELVIPVGKTVRINLTSDDVVHGFYVKQFNFSRYAQPGVLNQFDFNVTTPGEWQSQCTQLCGLYHSLMYFRVKAVMPSVYQQCLTSSNSGPKLQRGPNFVSCVNEAEPSSLTAASDRTSNLTFGKGTNG